MHRYRPSDFLPAEVLNRTDFSGACADRDLGAVFGIAIKYGAGFTPSHLARRCEMTVSKVQDYVNGRTLAQSIIVFERVADGLHIPGHKFGMAHRPWEDSETSFNKLLRVDAENYDPVWVFALKLRGNFTAGVLIGRHERGV